MPLLLSSPAVAPMNCSRNYSGESPIFRHVITCRSNVVLEHVRLRMLHCGPIERNEWLGACLGQTSAEKPCTDEETRDLNA
jgi:hypothetical protein